MHRLLLVKHAHPILDPHAPPAAWRLSDEGRASCIPLATAIAPYNPIAIFSSDEPKALETAQIVANKLNLTVMPNHDLGEHVRPQFEPMRADTFRQTVHAVMQQPNDLILGSETGAEALSRFQNGITDSLENLPGGNVAIVAHGTVISMFVANLLNTDPAPIWDSLGLPGLLVVTWPEAKGIEYQKNFATTPQT